MYIVCISTLLTLHGHAPDDNPALFRYEPDTCMAAGYPDIWGILICKTIGQKVHIKSSELWRTKDDLV